MSGVEVLSIISAVISIVDATFKVYNAAKDEAGLPPNFNRVATKLPPISKLLEDAETYVKNEADRILASNFTPVLTDCTDSATQLKQLFEQVMPAEGDSRLKRYAKAARTIGKGGRVETLMKTILENLQLLATSFPNSMSRRGQENLEEAIEDVSKMESSLPDGFENASTFANYGSGAQNVNTGAGSQYNHQNNGPGNQYVGTNHIGPSNNFGASTDNNFRLQADVIKGSVNIYPAHPALRYKSEEHKTCIQDLFITDPLDDKKALKRKKGDRVAGTCEWILDTEDLTAWLEPSHAQDSRSHANQVLWLHGNPGTGKSTLAMYLTDELSKRFSAADGHTLAYFFCDSAFDTRRTATSVVRTLLLQLIQQHPQLLNYVLPKYNERKAKLFKSFDALWSIFIAAAADHNTGKKCFIIDALDECDDESQKTLLLQLRETFHNHYAPSNVRILVTSRPYQEIRNHLDVFPHKDLTSFPEVKHDIDQVITKRVAEFKYTKKIKGQVTELLREKAEGTFLWVGIACNELKNITSKDAIARLEAMPSSLHSLYENLLSAALEKETEKGMIRLVLGIVAVSQRPLELLELSEACRLCEDEDDIETRTQFMRDYIESCRLMVMIEDDKVFLLHQSVKDYLIEAGEQTCFSEPEVHANLAYRCLDCIIEQFRNPNEPHGYLSDYAISEWPNHARMAKSSFAAVMTAQAEFFHVTSPCREYWLSTYRCRFSSFSLHAIPLQFSILHVAARWGITAIVDHVSGLYNQHGEVDRLIDLKDASDDTALDCAIKHGNLPVIHILSGLVLVITEKSTLLAARNLRSGKDIMALLLDRRGSEITITEEVVIATVGNWVSGKDIMALLLDRRGSEITITEEVVKAAAGYGWRGRGIMELFLNRLGSEITITKEMVMAAAGYGWRGRGIVELFLDRLGSEITITEEMVMAAAGYGWRGRGIMELFLDRLGSEGRNVMLRKAVAENAKNLKGILTLTHYLTSSGESCGGRLVEWKLNHPFHYRSARNQDYRISKRKRLYGSQKDRVSRVKLERRLSRPTSLRCHNETDHDPSCHTHVQQLPAQPTAWPVLTTEIEEDPEDLFYSFVNSSSL